MAILFHNDDFVLFICVEVSDSNHVNSTLTPKTDLHVQDQMH